MSLEDEVEVIYAVTNGFSDEVPVEKMRDWEDALHKFMGSNYPDVGNAIASSRDLNDETAGKLRTALGEFKQSVTL